MKRTILEFPAAPNMDPLPKQIQVLYLNFFIIRNSRGFDISSGPQDTRYKIYGDVHIDTFLYL